LFSIPGSCYLHGDEDKVTIPFQRSGFSYTIPSNINPIYCIKRQRVFQKPLNSWYFSPKQVVERQAEYNQETSGF
jgi:hypothetical protein